MLYFNNPHTKNLVIFFLLLPLPIAKAIPDELGQQVNQLQSQINEVNEKIAALEINKQKILKKVNALQANLNAVQQNSINGATYKNESLETARLPTRKANGHGR